MTPAQFNYMRDMLKQRSGLILSDDKGYLLESRLTPVARRHGLGGLEELVLAAMRNPPEALLVDITEAMTTNESFFFRDQKPFDLFKNHVLPHMIEHRATSRTFRIWSAASSSGQEPYSLSMILKEEAARLPGWRHEIVGTDLSSEIIKKAEAGIYSQFEVQRGMPITLLVKYFDKNDDQWKIKPEIRDMVQYRIFNLLHDLKPLGKFDVVFCRNVLIYFDQPTKTKVLEQVADMMPDDGFLFLGGAETVLGITEKFAPVPGQRGIYKRNL